jgi:hypothetical protein
VAFACLLGGDLLWLGIRHRPEARRKDGKDASDRVDGCGSSGAMATDYISISQARPFIAGLVDVRDSIARGFWHPVCVC